MKKTILFIALITFMIQSHAQTKRINTKVSSSKRTMANTKKIPLMEATNRDIARKVNYTSKSKLRRSLPNNTLTTILPAVVSSARSKLDLTLTPRKVYNTKGYIITNGYFNSFDNEIWLDFQASDNLNIAFKSVASGKSYLVNLELNNAYNDFIHGATKCDNPKLIIQMNGVEQLFDLTTGVNKLQFVVQTRTSGTINIPLVNGSCQRTNIKPKIRFKKVNISEI